MDGCQHCIWCILALPTFCIVCFCIDGQCHLWYILLLQCKICGMFICAFHVLIYVHVHTCTYLYDLYVQIHNHHWMDLLLTHPLWQCGLPWTRWQREGASWQCSHPFQVYNLKTLNRWVPEHRPQQDCGTACWTLWTWIAIGNWCSCRHSSPPPGYRVVLYTLTLFIDDCKDYAFSLACQQVCQQTWIVNCWELCV